MRAESLEAALREIAAITQAEGWDWRSAKAAIGKIATRALDHADCPHGCINGVVIRKVGGEQFRHTLCPIHANDPH